MAGSEPKLLSDEWQAAGVHWHAFAYPDPNSVDYDAEAEEETFGPRAPDAVLRSPGEVAAWIEQQLRAHAGGRHWLIRTYGMRLDWTWEDLRHRHAAVASIGGSIKTEIYSGGTLRDVSVMAMTGQECARCRPTPPTKSAPPGSGA